MRTITDIFAGLADFSLPAAPALTRLEALQPAIGKRDCLDLEPFLGAQ